MLDGTFAPTDTQTVTAVATPAVQRVEVQALASSIVAVSWTTDLPAIAGFEVQAAPFTSDSKQGLLFPVRSMSTDHYTRVLSTRHDLCATDLIPGTLYSGRVWNKDERGNESASAPFTFHLPPLPPEHFAFSKSWFGLQLAEEWRSLDEAKKVGAVEQRYIRILEILQQWDEVQPTLESTLWSLEDGRGIDDQLQEIEQRVGSGLGETKFVRLVLRAGGALGGKRMPDWAESGVQSVAQGDDDKVVRWDPVYTSRYWKLVAAAGARYGQDPRILSVAVQSVSKTGEMTMSRSLLDAYRALGYLDVEIAENMKWLYRNSLRVYAESFPLARLQLNMGRIQIADGGQEVGDSILDAGAGAYAKRISFGTTGFDAVRAELLTRYRDRVVVGGFSEKPGRDSLDPVAELERIFGLVWPHSVGLGWVSLHDDALGIHPSRWSGLPELKAFLEDVEDRFAQLREDIGG
jgi:hypothetical protein